MSGGECAVTEEKKCVTTYNPTECTPLHVYFKNPAEKKGNSYMNKTKDWMD